MIRLAALVWLVLASALVAQSTPERVEPSTLPAIDGTVLCPVSGTRHRSTDHAVRYRGRVHFMGDAACARAFLDDPGRFAAKVEPRGLFHATDAGLRSNAVWIAGLLVVLALVAGAFIAFVVVRKRRREEPTTHPPAACAGCGASLHPTAARCARCGATREPSGESDVVRLGGAR